MYPDLTWVLTETQQYRLLHEAKENLQQELEELFYVVRLLNRAAIMKESEKWELRCPPTGTGTDSGEATTATWPWFSAMHEAIGGRPSIEPPILIDMQCRTSCSAVSKYPGLSPSASVEESEEDTMSSAQSGTGNFQEERPCTSSGPPPPKKKRSNRVLDFLEKETVK
ncbi:unnamed protein product [Leuciscus chuanchicus]